jgi:hypothetical protein
MTMPVASSVITARSITSSCASTNERPSRPPRASAWDAQPIVVTALRTAEASASCAALAHTACVVVAAPASSRSVAGDTTPA